MIERLIKHWITSVLGLLLLAGAAVMFYIGKISWDAFVAFLPVCIALFWAKNTFLTEIFKKGGGAPVIILALSLPLSSCKHTQQLPAVQPSVINNHSQSSDSSGGTHQVGYLPADSSTLTALFRCDSLGNVYLQTITELRAGQHVKPEIEYRDNYITLKCKTDSAAVYERWSRFHKATSDTIMEVKYLPGTVTNRLNGFQRAMVTIGILACVAIALFIIIKAIKPKFL